ncbi:hypothetical protein Tco_0618798 [Tanacetum coccineum]
MNKGENWKPIIVNFQKKLASWNARNLLTLIKSVLGALGTYVFSIFKAPKEKNAPWRRLITSIHGTHGGLDQGYPFNSIRPSTSKTIIGLNRSMLDLHIDLVPVFVKKVGDGLSFALWKDVWIGEKKLGNFIPSSLLPRSL